eukprot:COSAG05_NODE_2664_length_2786_cov_26.732409_1_plen_374_part_10
MMRLAPFAVLQLLTMSSCAEAGACSAVVCEETCLPAAGAPAALNCTTGYTQGSWSIPSTTCPEGCVLTNWADKQPIAVDGDDRAACCDDASYRSYQTCDVNGDASRDYRDYLQEYGGIPAAKGWIARSASDDKTCRCSYTENSLNAFSFEQLQSGAVCLYILGVLYMFVALQIIVDEFFVPAMEVASTKLGLSDDVAGATCMAAAGSAPEFFISLIATFQQSSIGFGTIVGSAAFNALFIIGMCALFSSKAVQLTWWPLARDCFYYACSLLVLAIFFGVVADHPDADRLKDPTQTWEGQPGGPNDGVRFHGDPDTEVATVHIWEATILFVMYIGYVLVMANDQKLREKYTGAESIDSMLIQAERGIPAATEPSL